MDYRTTDLTDDREFESFYSTIWVTFSRVHVAYQQALIFLGNNSVILKGIVDAAVLVDKLLGERLLLVGQYFSLVNVIRSAVQR